MSHGRPLVSGTGSTIGVSLTSLGVSAYAQTLLDDSTAGAARQTLGAPATGAFIVNPGESGAYQTIQAALDAGVAATSAGGVIVVTCKAGTYAGNIVVPAGRIVSILFPDSIVWDQGISGTVTWNGGADDVLCFANCSLSGAVGGVATGFCYFLLHNVDAPGTITFTGAEMAVKISGGAASYDWVDSGGINVLTTTGQVSIARCGVYALITAGGDIALDNIRLGGDAAFSTSGTDISLTSCTYGHNGVNFAFTGSAGVVDVDGWSLSETLRSVATVTNGIIAARAGGISKYKLAQTNNIAAFDMIVDPPAGHYRVDVSVIVTTLGTLGTLQPNIVIKDSLGAATVALGAGFNIAGTGRYSASYNFRQVDTTNIQATVTGIVTPGALAYDVQFTVTNIGNGV